MVCGDAFLLDFWCGFAEIFILFLFLFAVLQFYETKRFAVFRIQCGLRFSYAGAPVLCYSLRFLMMSVLLRGVFNPPPPPTKPLRPPPISTLKLNWDTTLQDITGQNNCDTQRRKLICP